MRFSETLTEYLALRDDEKQEDSAWAPIDRQRQRSVRMTELLEGMDQLIEAAGVKGEARA